MFHALFEGDVTIWLGQPRFGSSVQISGGETRYAPDTEVLTRNAPDVVDRYF